MDETKIELPAWLPWATTACLAALVACLSELWIIERTRTQMLRDESQMAAASLKAAENQLEAERIVNSREIAELRLAAPRPALLLEPGADPAASLLAGRPWGAAAWDAGARVGSVRLFGLTAPGDNREYLLWIDAPGPGFPRSVALTMGPGDGTASASVRLESPLPAGSGIILTLTQKGGARTLDNARSEGSIILASLPLSPKITK